MSWFLCLLIDMVNKNLRHGASEHTEITRTKLTSVGNSDVRKYQESKQCTNSNV